MSIRMARKQKGFTLTEALVAFVVTAGGLIALASFQAGLFSESAYSKARTEAMSLAQQKIEEFRHYTHASEDNFIDDNGDGVMDADGTYNDDPIDGQNAQFTRSWVLTTISRGKQIDVTVSWRDSADQNQSVMLATELAWVSPRAGADQLAELTSPFVPSPTGRAEIGDGNLSDYSPTDVTQVSGPGPDGLSLYQHDEDLFLVDPTNKILLTLVDACATIDNSCKDFVKISGTVYVDTANTSQRPEDIQVIAADAAHCERWVPSGTLSNPPATATNDYLYYNYTCYLGGGWHGNIGFVTTSGLRQRDKVCQGDPTALDAWDQPVIALRRAYRGMIHKTGSTTTLFSHGIKDATTLTGHDFVFTELAPDKTAGTHCLGADAPMTRDDSSNGTLFDDVPTDFFCLNADDDGDSVPDYLDGYDTSRFGASVHCPYDPTDPPVQSHKITGTVAILSERTVDTSSFGIVTSDGPGNCEWVNAFALTADSYQATYSCTVYDWGSGWTGFVEIRPNSNYIYCPSRVASFSAVATDRSHDFGCIGATTVSIQGAIKPLSNTATISSIVIRDLSTGYQGVCSIANGTSYLCQIPYWSINWNGTVTVSSNEYVCGAVGGVFSFVGHTAEASPYTKDIVLAKNSSRCPIL